MKQAVAAPQAPAHSGRTREIAINLKPFVGAVIVNNGSTLMLEVAVHDGDMFHKDYVAYLEERFGSAAMDMILSRTEQQLLRLEVLQCLVEGK